MKFSFFKCLEAGDAFRFHDIPEVYICMGECFYEDAADYPHRMEFMILDEGGKFTSLNSNKNATILIF